MSTGQGERVLCRHCRLPLACCLYLSNGDSKLSMYPHISATAGISSPCISRLKMERFGEENHVLAIFLLYKL